MITRQEAYDKVTGWYLGLLKPDLRVTPWGEYKGLKCAARVLMPYSMPFVMATPFGVMPLTFIDPAMQRLIWALQSAHDNPENWGRYGLNRAGYSDLICIAHWAGLEPCKGLSNWPVKDFFVPNLLQKDEVNGECS